MAPPRYSIIVPAYNEAERLGSSLVRMLAYIAESKWAAEIIVVNDGSRDRTAEVVNEFAGSNPIVRLIENPGNRGKGYSVRNGMLSAAGQFLLFTDADTQCGFKAFSRTAASTIFPSMKIERWGFDPEILFLARRYGLRVAEVPVSWAHDHRSKINPIRDGARMFGELMQVRINSATG